ncbi:hypothetical protein FSW04_24160 [Baekduia soli]|uniref:Uncharacterized protein n=1 Tax=Baekduia soli TaxID=496014 RepID=A0A5B8UCI8_9ACTN|nr:hypothetical protein [Baekduia soli]QEC50372.1 hypothetical protein FSW04_24160 [Baekduia soli]
MAVNGDVRSAAAWPMGRTVRVDTAGTSRGRHGERLLATVIGPRGRTDILQLRERPARGPRTDAQDGHRRGAGTYGCGLWGGTVGADPAPDDHRDMKLLDRSPGGFIIAANAVVFGTVGVEVWMLIIQSVAAMIFTMILIAMIAALLCRWMMSLMGPEGHLDYQPRPARQEPAVSPPQPVAVPVHRAVRTGTPVLH